MSSEEHGGDLLEMTSDIVSAYASNNQVAAADLPGLIKSVHAALTGLGGGEPVVEEPVDEPLTPAVPIDRSVAEDGITCLECGKSFKTLKRHLSSEHDLTPPEYRARWQLSKDYPLVAPSYSKVRAATAKKTGLGRKRT